MAPQPWATAAESPASWRSWPDALLDGSPPGSPPAPPEQPRRWFLTPAGPKAPVTCRSPSSRAEPQPQPQPAPRRAPPALLPPPATVLYAAPLQRAGPFATSISFSFPKEAAHEGRPRLGREAPERARGAAAVAAPAAEQRLRAAFARAMALCERTDAVRDAQGIMLAMAWGARPPPPPHSAAPRRTRDRRPPPGRAPPPAHWPSPSPAPSPSPSPSPTPSASSMGRSLESKFMAVLKGFKGPKSEAFALALKGTPGKQENMGSERGGCPRLGRRASRPPLQERSAPPAPPPARAGPGAATGRVDGRPLGTSHPRTPLQLGPPRGSCLVV